jgi:hypothetical protein
MLLAMGDRATVVDEKLMERLSDKIQIYAVPVRGVGPSMSIGQLGVAPPWLPWLVLAGLRGRCEWGCVVSKETE